MTLTSQGWKGLWSSDGGWLAAAKAINSIGELLKAEGVKFGFGGRVNPRSLGLHPAYLYRAGSFKRPLFGTDGKTCIGIETADGTRYNADKVVLAAGAWTPALVDLEDQCVSKVSRSEILVLIDSRCQAWVYAHMQLSPEEAKKFKDSPVVYNGDIGFFFEPNE